MNNIFLFCLWVTIYSLNLRDFWSHIEKKNGENLCLKCQRKTCRRSSSSSRSYGCDLIAWDTREISVFTIVVHEKDDRKLKISRQKLEKKEYYVLGHNGIAFQKKCYIIRKLIDWHLLLSMYSAFSNCFMSYLFLECLIHWRLRISKAVPIKEMVH